MQTFETLTCLTRQSRRCSLRCLPYDYLLGGQRHTGNACCRYDCRTNHVAGWFCSLTAVTVSQCGIPAAIDKRILIACAQVTVLLAQSPKLQRDCLGFALQLFMYKETAPTAAVRVSHQLHVHTLLKSPSQATPSFARSKYFHSLGLGPGRLRTNFLNWERPLIAHPLYCEHEASG